MADPIQLIGLLSTATALDHIINKYFIKLEPINPNPSLTYNYSEKLLLYDAKFKINKIRTGFFKKKKIPGINLVLNQGFLNMTFNIGTGTDTQIVKITSINCSIPEGSDENKWDLIKGMEVRIMMRISVDLTEHIKESWDYGRIGSNHVKALITNNLPIDVVAYNTSMDLNSSKKLKKVKTIHMGVHKDAAISIKHVAALYSNGNINDEYPNVDTTNIDWLNNNDVDRLSIVEIPIETIVSYNEIIIDIIYC